MRIAFILPSLKNSAPINVAFAIAKKLSESGNFVSIFYLKNDIGINLDPNIEFKKISFMSNFDWTSFDIIHSHMLRPDLFVFLRKPLLSNVKTLSTIHNYVYPELKSYYNSLISCIVGRIWLIAWGRFNKLITLTNHASDYYRKLSFFKNIEFVHNGRDIVINYDSIDEYDFKLITSLKHKYGHIIGAYCALVKRKRIDILIKHISRTKFGCLVVLGEGKEYENLIKLANNLNVNDRVIFLGNKYNAHQYNCLFDVYVIPSEDEGFGLALIEAALHNQNIVCSNIDVFNEIFDDNCVTFFDLNDENSIDDAINSALKDKVKANNAKNRALKYYSEKVMAENYFKIYKKLLME